MGPGQITRREYISFLISGGREKKSTFRDEAIVSDGERLVSIYG